MPTTVTPPAPEQGPDQYNLTQLADHIDRAAQLIADNGLALGDWWTTASLLPWATGTCLCTVGALGVAAGYRRGWEIDHKLVGNLRWDGKQYIEHDMHPALAELMRRMNFAHVDELFLWSDRSTQGEVVARLRAIAAQMRIDHRTGITHLMLATAAVGDLDADQLDQAMPALRELAQAVNSQDRPVTT